MQYIKKHIIDNIEESYSFQLKLEEKGYLNEKYRAQLELCYKDACNIEKQYQDSDTFIKMKIILIKVLDNGVIGIFPTIAKKLVSEKSETYENNSNVEKSQEWTDEFIKNTCASDRLLGVMHTSCLHILPNKKIIEIVYSQEINEKLNGKKSYIFEEVIELRESAILNMSLENDLTISNKIKHNKI